MIELAETSDSIWHAILQNEDTVALIGAFSVAAIAVVGALWYRLARFRTEADLKQSMIERGMSVEEIERVLKAKSPDR